MTFPTDSTILIQKHADMACVAAGQVFAEGAHSIIARVHGYASGPTPFLKDHCVVVPGLTPRDLDLFLAYSMDAGNWSGMPLVGGNVGTEKADQGNLTNLKKAGLVVTDEDEQGDSWLFFTPAGADLAEKAGISRDTLYIHQPRA